MTLWPPGAGLMYVRETVTEKMKPRTIGANATQNFLHWLNYDMTPADGAGRFELGTRNVPGMFALVESLGLLSELGIANIDSHTTSLAATTIDMMAGLGWQPITPRNAHGSIVTCVSPYDNETTDRLISELDAADVCVIKQLDPDGGPHLRISFHCYNNEDDIQKLESAIKDFEK